ncbi:MAG: hypothetical protein OXT70_01300 [Chloroflexota bacterium]|nr:hypothetical protein [Chloroflexota bacterium]
MGRTTTPNTTKIDDRYAADVAARFDWDHRRVAATLESAAGLLGCDSKTIGEMLAMSKSQVRGLVRIGELAMAEDGDGRRLDQRVWRVLDDLRFG